MKAAGAVPLAPGSLPLVGHAASLLRSPLAFLANLPAHGDLVRIKVGPLSAVVVCDPDLTHQVLVDDRTFDKGGLLYDRAREGLGTGLGTCSHSTHRRQRRLTQPAFHTRRLPGYAQTMASQITAITSDWHDGKTIDVLDAMQTIAARAIVATMFTKTPGDISITGILHDLNTLSKGIYKRMWMPSALDKIPIPGHRRHNEARTRLRRTIGQIIGSYRGNDTDHGDLLSILLASPGESALSDAEITDELMSIFIAGMETVSATLSWTWHLLASHPSVESRMHSEIDSILNGEPIGHSDLRALPFTGRIITESLRLYPPGWLFTRTTTIDTQLGEHFIAADTTVIYSPYLIHHQAALYPNPERFDPDRWDSEEGRMPQRGAMIPFGGGARKCIGDVFGVTEATLALATIATNWRLTPVPGTRVRPGLGAVLYPDGQLMRITARPVIQTSGPSLPHS